MLMANLGVNLAQCPQHRISRNFTRLNPENIFTSSYKETLLHSRAAVRLKPVHHQEGLHRWKPALQRKVRPRLTAAAVRDTGRRPLDGDTSGIRDGVYVVNNRDIESFHEQGFVHLPGVLSEEEMQQVIDPVYHDFLQGKIEVVGKDLCDMSGAKDRTPDQYTVYNVMLPRLYYPAWQGNVFEQRCKAIGDQLQGGDMVPDYDQILAKRPQSADAIFAWHQDMAYWPPFSTETATATCWLAVSNATRNNGCMRFLPGSHREAALRSHTPVGASRAESHALKTELTDDDVVVEVPIRRGDITVHNERVVHGSGPNLSDGWRKAYVLAFRKASCVAEERSWGFTHSHNDTFSWDKFHAHQKT